MPTSRLALLHRRRSWRARARRWLWREWAFARAVARQLWWRFAILAALLAAGAWLFRRLEPEQGHTPVEALFSTWSLVFGQSAGSFPRSPALQALYFVAPVLGLTVIISGIVEFAEILRDRRRNERNWSLAMIDSLRDHIILVGLGRLGYRIYQILHELDERVVVLESQPDNPFLERVREHHSPLLIGDARRDELLVEAGVARAKSVVLATNDDLANMEIALDARRLAPGIRVVLRMFDQNMADKIREGFDIHLAMSQSAISAPAFATAALDRTIVNSFVIDNELVVMQRWSMTPGHPWLGKSVADLVNEHQVQVLEIRRGGSADRAGRSARTILMPVLAERLEAGDDVLVQGLHTRLRAMRG